MQYLKHSEIDKSLWDKRINEAFNGMVYGESWYLDIVAETWDALINEDYEQLFPLVFRKKWGLYYLYQPIFTQQLGLFSKSLLTPIMVSNFLNGIPSHFRFGEINLNTFNQPAAGDFKMTGWVTFELDLINSIENLRKNYSENLKRKIKKNEREKISIIRNIKPDDIITLFKENKGNQLGVYSEADYQKLHRLAYTGIYRGSIFSYAAYTATNELCAGALFLKNRKKIIFLFSGLSAHGRKINAMASLIDGFIQDHAGSHLTLDFEGSNNPDLARFYHSFGSKRITYPHVQINRFPLGLKQLVNLIKPF